MSEKVIEALSQLTLWEGSRGSAEVELAGTNSFKVQLLCRPGNPPS